MSDLLLILMTIFNNSCIFYHIFLMLCCGILLKEIPSSMSNYLWHQRGIVSFWVRGMEMSRECSALHRSFGKTRGPQGRASLFPNGEVLTTPVMWGMSELPHLLQVPKILCVKIDSFEPWRHFLFKCSLLGSSILRRKTHYQRDWGLWSRQLKHPVRRT